jgi:hypothetical protein
MPVDNLAPPPWTRPPPRDADPADALFRTAGALALLSAALAAPMPARGCWLDRLAVEAAAAGLAAGGRTDTPMSVRDAVHLAGPDDDPGPAGRMVHAWQALVGHAPDPHRLIAAVAAIGVRADEERTAIVAAAMDGAPSPSPPHAAARAAAAAARARPDLPALPFLVADLTLARRLGWPATVPLSAVGAVGRRPRPDDPRWPERCVIAFGRGTAAALERHRDLAARADALDRARVRTKGAAAVFAALLDQDALAPARLPGGITDRAGRRLFERLVAQGAVRELTGRRAFRLYGL